MYSPFVVRRCYGVGAVLLQPRDDVLIPCRYASKKLSPSEMNYSTIERECLAIVFAVNQFYKFLAFRHFELQTDHKPLVFLKKGSLRNSRLMRGHCIFRNFLSRSPQFLGVTTSTLMH
ncbi:retrovirus-related pol polyprotein from transposon 17.6 [Plakobranchus ocellatus]|uniref:Retrovirus-related pol polyprotein from transposon 17.6 n=1 Tax=Plakobranchus ocellatus TaxID=259542 RepID=A0AAV4AHV8_9GAST|nr:retrovirus-related pol polyprotein from transposon 17.6 [Plakobranchus ocellatus]